MNNMNLISLIDLDNYIHQYLYDFIEPKDLLSLLRTCKYYYNVITNNNHISKLLSYLKVPRLEFYANTAYEQICKMGNTTMLHKYNTCALLNTGHLVIGRTNFNCIIPLNNIVYVHEYRDTYNTKKVIFVQYLAFLPSRRTEITNIFSVSSESLALHSSYKKDITLVREICTKFKFLKNLDKKYIKFLTNIHNYGYFAGLYEKDSLYMDLYTYPDWKLTEIKVPAEYPDDVRFEYYRICFGLKYITFDEPHVVKRLKYYGNSPYIEELPRYNLKRDLMEDDLMEEDMMEEDMMNDRHEYMNLVNIESISDDDYNVLSLEEKIEIYTKNRNLYKV